MLYCCDAACQQTRGDGACSRSNNILRCGRIICSLPSTHFELRRRAASIISPAPPPTPSCSAASLLPLRLPCFFNPGVQGRGRVDAPLHHVHRGQRQVQQRPHHRGVRQGHLARAAPEAPGTVEQQQARRGRLQQGAAAGTGCVVLLCAQ